MPNLGDLGVPGVRVPPMPALMMAPDFTSASLYAHLGLPKSASSDTIRRTYYRLALQHHPDRNPSASVAEFQQIGRAYEILSNEAKRKLYDESGIVDGEDLGAASFEAYFKEMFNRVRLEDIDTFKGTYVGSVEEYEDVLAAYRRSDGSIEAAVDGVFFGDDEGALDRFAAMIKRAIAKGILDESPQFHQLISDDAALGLLKKKRKRTADKEAKEAAKLAKELGLDKKMGDLHSLIKPQQKSRFDSMIAGLEAKYGGPEKKRTKRK